MEQVNTQETEVQETQETTEVEVQNEPNETVSSDTTSNEDGSHEQDSAPQSEDLEEYDFSEVWGEGAEVDQAMVDAYSDKFKELHLSNAQANALMKMGVEHGQFIAESFERAREEAFAAKEEETRNALGKNLEGELRYAGAAIEVFEKQNPGFRKWLDESGNGNDLNMVRLCAFVGRLVSEDPGHLGKGQSVNSGDPLKQRWNNSPEMFK